MLTLLVNEGGACDGECERRRSAGLRAHGVKQRNHTSVASAQLASAGAQGIDQ